MAHKGDQFLRVVSGTILLVGTCVAFIMLLRRIVEKYCGMHAVEGQNDFFSMKLLIPLFQNRKGSKPSGVCV